MLIQYAYHLLSYENLYEQELTKNPMSYIEAYFYYFSCYIFTLFKFEK